MRIPFLPLLVALLAAAVLPATAGAADRPFAPGDRPGPPLTVPKAQLEDAITCRGDFSDHSKPAVLLVPGTFVDAQDFYSWNLMPALSARGIPWCAVSAPNHNLGDIAVAGEYDTYAIRKTFALAGRPISVVGHSQGGMQPRWALRFWPDTRAMVADQVGVAAAHHGAPPEDLATLFPTVIFATCGLRGCPPAVWQLDPKSRFLAAMNSDREMFAPVSYTSIYSTSDEVVAPSSTVLHGAASSGGYRRTAIQDVCPGRISDHVLDGTVDPVSFALVLDAIEHPGPADPGRIDRSVCSQLTIPGLDPIATVSGALPLLRDIIAGVALPSPLLRAEPALPCYVYADCPTATAAAAPTNAAPRARARIRRASGAARYVLDGRRSTDADGRIVRWRWSVGGKVVSRRARLVRRIRATGRRTVRVALTVTDDDGATSTVRRTVRGR
ncbi:PKD domain-containing protein [Patulibacter sp. NPDC049589]|uniref:PKD domain-containing protein n=1 Tax=Patulibacter sp. NPDC049589 TaxID=3154731 RepID=UPI003422DE2E